MMPEKNILACTKCGYKKELDKNESVSFTEEIEHDYKMEMIKSEVIDEKISDDTKPSKDMHCPTCNKITKVSYWQRQTRSADESPTRFFQCIECGQTWREYD